jgi:hypothetical protein
MEGLTMSRSAKRSCTLSRILTVLLLLIPALLSTGCTEDNPALAEDAYGALLESVGCKTAEGDMEAQLASGEECLEWDLNGRVLSLTHVDAAFNCCPESLTAEVLIDGSSITVIEGEVFDDGGECDCICLFDLHIAVYDLTPDVYTVSVSGPYSPEPLDTTIDLVAQPTGRYCEDREVYPWI